MFTVEEFYNKLTKIWNSDIKQYREGLNAIRKTEQSEAFYKAKVEELKELNYYAQELQDSFTKLQILEVNQFFEDSFEYVNVFYIQKYLVPLVTNYGTMDHMKEVLQVELIQSTKEHLMDVYDTYMNELEFLDELEEYMEQIDLYQEFQAFFECGAILLYYRVKQLENYSGELPFTSEDLKQAMMYIYDTESIEEAMEKQKTQQSILCK